MPKPVFLKFTLAVVITFTVAGVGYAGLMVWRDEREPQNYYSMRGINEPVPRTETGELASREESGDDRYQTESRFDKMPDWLPDRVPDMDTSNWKVYQSTEYGFEVFYPPSWTAVENWGQNTAPSIVSLVSPKTQSLTERPYPLGLLMRSADINIYVESAKDLQTHLLRSYVEDKFPSLSDIREISVNGRPAVTARRLGSSRAYSIFFWNDHNVYNISFEETFEAKTELTEIDRTILHTLKFH